MELEEFVDALPKVELHVHLEGSVRPSTLLELAKRHGTSSLPEDLDGLREFYRFRDFPHFVEVYMAVCDQLVEEEDFALIVRELGETLAGQNVRYAEVTFTPYNHTRRGIAPEVVFGGVERGRQEAKEAYGIDLAFCTDIPGEFGPEAGMETIRLVLEHRTPSIVGFGLGGPEVGVPRGWFTEPFAMAREAGLHSVPHAGETTGPETVWDALHLLGAERIGHGLHSLKDPELVAHLVEHRIPLEVCPTSNLRLGQVPDLASHPLPRMLEAGLVVTLGSDDPPMFNTTLRDEYLAAGRVLGLSRAELAGLAASGVRCSFLPEEAKAALLDEIAAVPTD